MKTITDRHQFILQKLREESSVKIPDLIKKMKVSGVTIRKDLKTLELKRLLFRTKGGASISNPYAIERDINEKAIIKAEEKKIIAKAGLNLIGQNDSIMIGSGTTVFELAKQFYPQKKVIVITPALRVSLELYDRPNIEVLHLGGIINQTSASSAGTFTEKILDELACGVLFLGADGIDVEYGLSITNIVEASLNKKMISLAQTVVVLADSSKFEKRGVGKICNLSKIDYIVTDSKVDAATITKIEKCGVKIIIA